MASMTGSTRNSCQPDSRFPPMQEVTKEPLGNEDFGMILDTLCLDGKVTVDHAQILIC